MTQAIFERLEPRTLFSGDPITGGFTAVSPTAENHIQGAIEVMGPQPASFTALTPTPLSIIRAPVMGPFANGYKPSEFGSFEQADAFKDLPVMGPFANWQPPTTPRALPALPPPDPASSPPVLFSITADLTERDWSGGALGRSVSQSVPFDVPRTGSGSDTFTYLAEFRNPATGGSYSRINTSISAGEASVENELLLQWIQTPGAWLGWPGVGFDNQRITAWVRGEAGTQFGGTEEATANFTPGPADENGGTPRLTGRRDFGGTSSIGRSFAGSSSSDTIEVDGVTYSRVPETFQYSVKVEKNGASRNDSHTYLSTHTFDSTVRIFIDAGLNPDAEIDAPSSAVAGVAIKFDGGESTDRDNFPAPISSNNNGIIQYRWFDVTDGSRSLLGTEEVLSVTFADPGFRAVELEVVDDEGMRDIATTTLDILPAGPSLEVTGNWLFGEVEYSPNGDRPEFKTVVFTNSGSEDSELDIELTWPADDDGLLFELVDHSDVAFTLQSGKSRDVEVRVLNTGQPYGIYTSEVTVVHNDESLNSPFSIALSAEIPKPTIRTDKIRVDENGNALAEYYIDGVLTNVTATLQPGGTELKRWNSLGGEAEVTLDVESIIESSSKDQRYTVVVTGTALSKDGVTSPITEDWGFDTAEKLRTPEDLSIAAISTGVSLGISVGFLESLHANKIPVDFDYGTFHGDLSMAVRYRTATFDAFVIDDFRQLYIVETQYSLENTRGLSHKLRVSPSSIRPIFGFHSSDLFMSAQVSAELAFQPPTSSNATTTRELIQNHGINQGPTNRWVPNLSRLTLTPNLWNASYASVPISAVEFGGEVAGLKQEISIVLD